MFSQRTTQAWQHRNITRASHMSSSPMVSRTLWPLDKSESLTVVSNFVDGPMTKAMSSWYHSCSVRLLRHDEDQHLALCLKVYDIASGFVLRLARH